MQVLENDNSKHIVDVKHKIEYAKKSKVIIEMEEVENV